MQKYLLNSAVITAPGVYNYRHITPEEANAWYHQPDQPVISTIGYAETAAALSELLGAEVRVNKISVVMLPGDEALVFRVVLPPGSPRLDPKDKGRISQLLRDHHWELGLLRRIG